MQEQSHAGNAANGGGHVTRCLPAALRQAEQLQ